MLLLQLCPTLCNPIDSSPPGSSVHEIFQARILEWVAMPSFRGSSPPRDEPLSPASQADSLLSEPPRKSDRNQTNSWFWGAAAAASLQSCPTLRDPIDGSPPGSPIPGILQARTLERVAISFSNAWKWKVKVKTLSHVRLFETPWTAAYQAPPSMGFSRQEYWSGVPLPSPSEGLGHVKRAQKVSQVMGMFWVLICLCQNWLNDTLKAASFHCRQITPQWKRNFLKDLLIPNVSEYLGLSFICYKWKSKMVPSLWKTVWQFEQIHVDVWQKPTQHCKAIILQLKIKFKKNWTYPYHMAQWSHF